MSRFAKRGNTTHQGGYVEKNTNNDIKDISAEIYIAVDGESPSRSESIEKVIPAIGVIQNLSNAIDYFSIGKAFVSKGILMASKAYTVSNIEGSFTPNAEKLARVGCNLEKKLASKRGYNLYVRIKYLKHEHYAFDLYNPWKEEYTEWTKWEYDGQDGNGNFFYKEDITKNIIKKVMEWRVRLFVREKL